MTKQDILNLVEAEDVKFIRLQFSDMLGRMRNLAITVSELEDALDNRCMFDGSSINGFVDIEDSDLFLHPVLDTFLIFPWRPNNGKVARLICNVHKPDGEPLVCDSRLVLQRVIDEAREKGYILKVGAECEFFLMKTDEDGKPLLEPHDDASYFDLAPLDNGENCRRDICITMEDMGFDVANSHHEKARGQHEITFKEEEAMLSADKLVIFKTAVKTMAQKNGLHATFMPKPFANQQGSGLHLTFSIIKDGKNIFANDDDSARLSKEGYKFIAGLLRYTNDMLCLTNPTVNSYKRLIEGTEAPCYLSWSEKNRSLLARIPARRASKDACVEFRLPDPTANPYLALAACFKAGLLGMENDIELPPSVDVNLNTLSRSQLKSLGVSRLPVSLNDAIAKAKNSEFISSLLGVEFKEEYLAAKAKEYNEYRLSISQWEIDNYLINY